MSDSLQEMFDRVAELTELYLLDEISDEQLAELETLVSDNEAAAQAMRAVLKQAGTMRVVFAEQQQFASRVGEVDRSEYLALLQTLSPTEEPEPVRLVGRLESKRPLWQQWQFVIPSAIAALLAIAVTLIVALPGNESSTPIADTTSTKPAEMAPPILRDTPGIRPVATLTNTHNATWAGPASAAPAPGSKLHPNQRLTLTAGFAEITTHRGAVAIIEAPATVELLDNNNALRLHTGKLVGLCHTESSKGFVVKTEHADITDLGTEFGVQVTGTGLSATVFTGEIEVTAPGATPQLLLADQTASLSIDGNNRELVIDNRAATGFDALRMIPATYSVRLPGTGEGLEQDTHDPNWRITAIDGQALDSPLPLRVSGYTTGNPDPLAPSAMLAYNPTHGRADAIYRIETNLHLPDIVDPERVQVFVRFRMDNEMLSLQVNGQDVPVPDQDTAVYGRDYTMVIQGPLRPGNNHFAFEVENEGLNTQQNPIGVQVKWHLQPVPAEPQNKPTVDE